MADTTYAAQHVPIDQAQLVHGAQGPLYSERAMERAGWSYGLKPRSASTALVNSPLVARHLDLVSQQQQEAEQDAALSAVLVDRTASDVLNNDKVVSSLTNEQLEVLNCLMDAEAYCYAAMQSVSSSIAHVNQARQRAAGAGNNHMAVSGVTAIVKADALTALLGRLKLWQEIGRIGGYNIFVFLREACFVILQSLAMFTLGSDISSGGQ